MRITKTAYSRWFRMYGDLIDDLKMAKLTDKTFRVFVEILCLQCLDGDEHGNTGMSVDQYKWRSRRKNPALEIESLAKEKLINISPDGFIIVPKWTKRQYKSDNETSTERVKKYRSSNRLDIGNRNNDETFHETLDETRCNALDQNRSEQIRDIPPNPPAGGIEKPETESRREFKSGKWRRKQPADPELEKQKCKTCGGHRGNRWIVQNGVTAWYCNEHMQGQVSDEDGEENLSLDGDLS